MNETFINQRIQQLRHSLGTAVICDRLITKHGGIAIKYEGEKKLNFQRPEWFGIRRVPSILRDELIELGVSNVDGMWQQFYQEAVDKVSREIG